MMKKSNIFVAFCTLVNLSSLGAYASNGSPQPIKSNSSKDQKGERADDSQSLYLTPNELLETDTHRETLFGNLIQKIKTPSHQQLHMAIQETLQYYSEKITAYESRLEKIQKDSTSIRELEAGIKERQDQLKEIKVILEKYKQDDETLDSVGGVKSYLHSLIDNSEKAPSSKNSPTVRSIVINSYQEDLTKLSTYNEARLRRELKLLEEGIAQFSDPEKLSFEKVQSFILANKRAMNEILTIRAATIYKFGSSMEGYIFAPKDAHNLTKNYISNPHLLNTLDTEVLHKFLLANLEMPMPQLQSAPCYPTLKNYLDHIDEVIIAYEKNLTKEVFRFGAVLNFVGAASQAYNLGIEEYYKKHVNVGPMTHKDAPIFKALLKTPSKPVIPLFDESSPHEFSKPSDIFIRLLNRFDKDRVVQAFNSSSFKLFLTHVIPESEEDFFKRVCGSAIKSDIYSWPTDRDLSYEAGIKAMKKEDFSETLIQVTYNLIGGDMRLEALKTIKTNLTGVPTHKADALKEEDLFR